MSYKCRLADQLTEAEFQRMSQSYSSSVAVDTVTSSHYYTTITVSGIPVEGMVNSSSSATIMSFNLFQTIGRIPKEVLKPLSSGLVLQDYSQQLIPVGASVVMTFEWGSTCTCKSVTSTVFLRSDLGV